MPRHHGRQQSSLGRKHGDLRREERVLALELVSFCSPLKWRVGVRATQGTSFLDMPIQVKGRQVGHREPHLLFRAPGDVSVKD